MDVIPRLFQLVKLQNLYSNQKIEELKQVMTTFWTVCAKSEYNDLDKYIEGIGNSGTIRQSEGKRGTEVRIRFKG